MINSEEFKNNYGPWALVTGASSGIGESFCYRLAELGLNLVIAARRLDKLENIAKEITSQYSVEVKPVKVDLSQTDACDLIAHATEGLEIGLLVNNAGIDTYGAFLKTDVELTTQQLNVNCASPMYLAHHFGGDMAKRQKGGIIFVASTSAHSPLPYMSTYCASKAYLLFLGEALHYEMKKVGVDVTVLSPGGTDTPMLQHMADQGVDLDKIPTPMDTKDVVEAGLSGLGKKMVVIPGTANALMTWVATHLLPTKTAVSINGSMSEKIIPADRLM